MRKHPGFLLWVFLAYAIGLWKYSVPFTGDEKVYISTAMEMWVKGDWLHPRLLGVTSYFKPPFQYWMTLLGWSAFGFGQFGTFIPSVLAVVATAYFIGEISRLLGQSRSQTLAPLWFAGCAGTLTYGTTAQMEIWIVFFYAGAWWAALNFLERRRITWLYLALAIAGISSLVKSPLYAALWVLGFWIYLLMIRQTFLWKRLHFWAAHLVGIALGLSWFVYAYLTDGERFWSQYVLQETLGKKGGNGSSLLQFYGDFSTFALPWLLLLLPAFVQVAKSARENYPRVCFLLSWSLLPLVFFSAFPYRTETYLYILIPALSLVLDWGLRSPATTLDRYVCRLNGIVCLAALGALAYLTWRGGVLPFWVAAAVAGSAIAVGVSSWKCAWRELAFNCLLVIALVRVAAIALGEDDLSGLRKFIALHPDSPIAFFDEGDQIWHEIGLLSVAVGRPSERVRSVAEGRQALDDGKVLVLNDSQSQLMFMGAENPGLEVEEWPRWKRGFVVPKASDLSGASQNRRYYHLLKLTH